MESYEHHVTCHFTVIPNALKQTLRGDNFLLHDSGANDPDRFLIFGTERNLDMLADSSDWSTDGTLLLIYFISCIPSTRYMSIPLYHYYTYLCKGNENWTT